MWIREMTLQDCEALESLRDEPTLHLDPRVELDGRLTRAWVVSPVEAGAPVAYALGWWVVDELELLSLAVLPEARRQGIGRQLLEHVIATTRASGGRRVTLEVGRSNAAARQLYESAGFKVFNVRPNYYRNSGDDALEMEHVVDAAVS
jgi:ribosomal-protein-alanine N-acetyltransferase